MVYYLAIWFQGAQGVDAVESGVRTTPFILGFIIFAVLEIAVVRRRAKSRCLLYSSRHRKFDGRAGQTDYQVCESGLCSYQHTPCRSWTLRL